MDKVEILLFEDNPGDAGLIEEMLEEFADFPYELKNTETLKEGLDYLKEDPYDVILSDLGLPDSDGIDTFLQIHAKNSQIPIIILTAVKDEKIGIDAVKRGAQDYLVKGEVDGRLLIRSIQYSIERKKAEKEIKESEERYRIVTEQTGHLIYEYDIGKNEVYWKGAIEKITGYTPEELTGAGMEFWINTVHPEDRNKVLDQKIKGCEYNTHSADENDMKNFHLEYRFQRKDGKYIYIEDNGVCLQKGSYLINKVFGVMKDITERKRAEENLAKIEEARKKEIHHRIKNNLQVISSLLDLQAEKFASCKACDTSKVIEAFRESKNRVISMALIHEELYGSKEVSTLDFAAYLQKLATDLFRSYNVRNSGIRTILDVKEKTFLEIDTAVPLGIILNELVSNSLKYAFQSKNEGQILIKLCREEKEEKENILLDIKKVNNKQANYVLTVADDGIGIPESVNPESSETLGLQLISILVDQLDGKMELNRNGGTEFIIKFKA
ncbi:MAG: sensor histidine kinase [Methanosarcina sp.]